MTTVADAAWKGKIEPYAEHSPVLDIPAGVIACQFCGNTRFRRSRLRLEDVLESFLLRLPLRCMRCNQRQYGDFLAWSMATGTKAHEPRLARGNETWKSWTEQEAGNLNRPMSTAIGTRATKLQRPVPPVDTHVQGTSPGKQPARRDEDRQIG